MLSSLRLPATPHHAWRSAAARAIAAVCLLASAAGAQTVTGTVTTGMIVDQALSGGAVQDLEFGRMAPGSPKLVAAQDAQGCTDGCMAGKWIFQNVSKKGNDHYVNLQFSALPDSLVGPGGAKLGVTYTSIACVYKQATNASVGCVNQGATVQGTTIVVPINKVAGAIGFTKPQYARDLYLWVGGTASPAAGQRAGDYTGVITLVFAYGT